MIRPDADPVRYAANPLNLSGLTLVKIGADQQEADRGQDQEIEESEVLQNCRH